MTFEREKEIRSWEGSDCWHNHIKELLEEIDRFRAENKDLKLENDTSEYVKEIRHERDQVKDKLAVAEMALHNSINLTWLPHKLTHEQLLGSCNENVRQAQKALSKIRDEKVT